MIKILKNYKLEKKNILLTGAAGLLGNQFSNALLEADGNVILTDINEKELLQLEKNLLKKYKQRNIKCFKLDVTSEKSIVNLVKKLGQKKN